jgi:FkbM family methyltransferase
MDLKGTAIRSLMRLSGAWLRNPWLDWGKTAVWNRVCIPHLSWRSEEIVCRTVQGHRFRVRPNDFVENRLCFFGEWEPSITAVFEAKVQPGDVVVDVGANIGFYSVLAAKLVGAAGRVYALEPSASIRRRLDENLKLNHIANVTCYPYAAWYESGRSVLKLMDGNRGGSGLGATDNSTLCEEVEMRRLDDLIPREAWPAIRLMKVDVEGAEMAALRGAEQLLDAARDLTVICEITPDRLASLDATAAELFEFMAARGFAAYEIENDYSPDAYLRRRLAPPPTKMAAPPNRTCDAIFVRGG